MATNAKSRGSHSRKPPDYKSISSTQDNSGSSDDGQLFRDDDEKTFTIQEAIDHIGFGRFQITQSVIIGLCYMCEAMEMMLLSLLAPVLQCTWFLSGLEEALLTTSTFVGYFLSSSCWGVFCDLYGRKTTLLLMALWTGYFGILSALSPTFYCLVFIRFLVGLGFGAIPQSMTLYSEYLPTKSRGPCLFLITLMWALGSMLLALAGLLIIPTLGWRWLVVVSSIPLLLFSLLNSKIPESARFLLAHGNYDKAFTQLRQIALKNRCELPSGTLYDPSTKEVNKTKFVDLWHPSFRFTSFLLSFIWFASTVSYYGTVILTTALFENVDGCHGYDIRNSQKQDKCMVSCHTLTTADFVDLLITSLGEAPGLFVGVICFQKLGRRRGTALLFGVYGVSVLACNICAPRLALVLLLFTARAIGNTVLQGIYLYTIEIFPTSMRGTAVGWGNTIGKVSIVITPFIAQYLIKISAFIPITMFGVFGLLGCVCSLCLPVETRGRDMTDTIQESDMSGR